VSSFLRVPLSTDDRAAAVAESTAPVASRASDLGRFGRHFAAPSVAFTVSLPSGETIQLGSGEPRFHVRLKNRRALRAASTLDEGRFGDAYVAGDIDLDGDMMAPFALRHTMRDLHPLVAAWRFIEPRLFGQTRTNRRVIASHYDLDPRFFLSFLDPDVPSYSQGMFEGPNEPLRAATLRKFDYCFDKCRLQSGDNILEIGPGWGAWLEYATRRGLNCTGLSNSRASIEYLDKRARQLGSDWRLIHADVLDYRSEQKFDAIVMMGVIEHLPQYRRLLTKFESLLKPGGHIFLDGSAASRKYQLSTFMVKYIFPGNHSFMVLADLLDKLARTRLELLEVHSDRMNYCQTFQHWARNLDRNREFVIENFGEFNYRRFRLYLWAAAYEMQSRSLDCFRMIIRAPADEGVLAASRVGRAT
jgi:cyclopropane-fatty-acyl-phospholipid synthase